MTHSSKKLTCRGIVGDGCGGDREFVIENGTLFAIDPVTLTKMVLLENIKDAESLSKRGCNIYIQTKTKKITFNLQTLSIID